MTILLLHDLVGLYEFICSHSLLSSQILHLKSSKHSWLNFPKLVLVTLSLQKLVAGKELPIWEQSLYNLVLNGDHCESISLIALIIPLVLIMPPLKSISLNLTLLAGLHDLLNNSLLFPYCWKSLDSFQMVEQNVQRSLLRHDFHNCILEFYYVSNLLKTCSQRNLGGSLVQQGEAYLPLESLIPHIKDIFSLYSFDSICY